MAAEHVTQRFVEADLRSALNEVEAQLERAEAIENPLERFWVQERLLERHETLQTALEETVSPNEPPSPSFSDGIPEPVGVV